MQTRNICVVLHCGIVCGFRSHHAQLFLLLPLTYNVAAPLQIAALRGIATPERHGRTRSLQHAVDSMRGRRSSGH